MKVINLIAPPGSGKSTGAAYIFAQCKLNGINAELIQEFAKDKVWEENSEVFKNQAYIFGKQSFRMSRCKDKVDVLVTDSPLILSAFYNTDPTLGEAFDEVVTNVFNSYDNINYFINRVKPYNPKGRHQSEQESDDMRAPLLKFLKDHNIQYKEVDGDTDGYDMIVADIIETLCNEE